MHCDPIDAGAGGASQSSAPRPMCLIQQAGPIDDTDDDGRSRSKQDVTDSLETVVTRDRGNDQPAEQRVVEGRSDIETKGRDVISRTRFDHVLRKQNRCGTTPDQKEPCTPPTTFIATMRVSTARSSRPWKFRVMGDSLMFSTSQKNPKLRDSLYFVFILSWVFGSS